MNYQLLIFIAESWRNLQKMPFIQQYTGLDTLFDVYSWPGSTENLANCVICIGISGEVSMKMLAVPNFQAGLSSIFGGRALVL